MNELGPLRWKSCPILPRAQTAALCVPIRKVAELSGKAVVISGIGRAGPALAHGLLRYGFAPTLVERAPKLRTGGYIIDFWGAGNDIVEKMGLLPELLRVSYRVREVRIVDRRGRRVGGFDADVF